MNTETNRKKLDLCKILKNHIGEKFYVPLLGKVTLVNMNNQIGKLIFRVNDSFLIFINSDGLDELNRLSVFPDETCGSWEEFDDKQHNPKTWSEFTKYNLHYKKPFDKAIDVTGCGNSGWTRRNTPIEKQCLALIKINTLIEHSYGGHVKKEEWSDTTINKYIIIPGDSNKTFTTCEVCFPQNYSIIAFHTLDEAKEFLSYPENISLLNEFFIV